MLSTGLLDDEWSFKAVKYELILRGVQDKPLNEMAVSEVTELSLFLPYWREHIQSVDLALGISKAFGSKNG